MYNNRYFLYTYISLVSGQLTKHIIKRVWVYICIYIHTYIHIYPYMDQSVTWGVSGSRQK